jgi:hypothetical protein
MFDQLPKMACPSCRRIALASTEDCDLRMALSLRLEKAELVPGIVKKLVEFWSMSRVLTIAEVIWFLTSDSAKDQFWGSQEYGTGRAFSFSILQRQEKTLCFNV